MSMFDVTLTFDNGPEPDVTPAVLDVLARRSVKTTFFVVGHKLATPAGRKLAERAHAEGHWIGNHTWSHTVPFGLTGDSNAPLSEIGRTQEEIGALSHPHRYFRPFGEGGQLDRRLLSVSAVDFLARGRFTCVLWNSIPRDWEDAEGWVERALNQTSRQHWSLVVLHDLPTGAMRHLERFIELIRERGGRFRQEFPRDCTPMVGGEVVGPLEQYTASPG